MDTKYIVVTNGTGSHYDKRVSVANGKPSAPSAQSVFVRFQDGPETTRVLIVKHNADETVYIMNPSALPFDIKIEILGVPLCPRCGNRLIGETNYLVFQCNWCRVNWQRSVLEAAYQDRDWPPVGARRIF